MLVRSEARAGNGRPLWRLAAMPTRYFDAPDSRPASIRPPAKLGVGRHGMAAMAAPGAK